MRVENEYGRALRYVEALKNEIRIAGRILSGNGRPMSVHFGGGTPNYLHVEDLARILQVIELELGLTNDSRLAIELDPRLVSKDDIQRLVDLGFSRMSLGVQDFDPEVQLAINRLQSFEMIEGAVSDIRRAGINDLSFDLLYGLPRQTISSFAQTIGKTIALAPDRVSVFGYAHMPGMLKRQRLIDEKALPSKVARSELSALADEMFVASGYSRIGFDHYAKPDNLLAKAQREGRLRRNFQGFTDDLALATIGFGASAISYVGGLYAQNAKTLSEYYALINDQQLPVQRGLELSGTELIIAQVIQTLLCVGKTDVTPLFAALPSEEVNAMCARLDQLENDGVVFWRENTLFIANAAWPLLRAVAKALDPLENKAPAKANPAIAFAV